MALERIQKILSADDIIHERPDAIDPGRVRGEITFEHVAFGYGGEPLVLTRRLASRSSRARWWASSARPAAASRRWSA